MTINAINIYLNLNLKIFNFLNFYNLRAFFPVFSRGLLQEQRAGRNRVKEPIAAVASGNGIRYFNDYIHEVESKVPKDKLIKFCVKEGWEPLCKQLNVPVPDVPFPRVNSTDEIMTIMAKMERRAWLLLYELVTIPVLSYFVYKLTCC